MFNVIKERIQEQRSRWIKETQERIQEYAELERIEAERRKHEETYQQDLLNEELDRFVRSTQPSFCLHPEVTKSYRHRLYAYTNESSHFGLAVSKEMKKAHRFFNKDLMIFIKLLERKGFPMKGNEERFMEAFIQKVRTEHHEKVEAVYGEIVLEHSTLSEAFASYLEVLPDEEVFVSGNLDYLHQQLIAYEIIPSRRTFCQLKRHLKEYMSQHATDHKIRKLEKKLQETG
ncbi:hypothetical protein [Salsuginibacillus kocurii]|uniref:hypothetical protein n=1 Tax=Salsuginibacillus kocurii TaxID=427078 RepID=UPI00036E03BC|nr:hypothetical protein [Salsuginibacillus kocurii]